MAAGHEIHLPHGRTAPAAARAQLRLLGATWNSHVREAVLLLTSEVVTNAVRHGRPPVVLQVTEFSEQLLLHVVDASSTALVPPAGGWRMPPPRAEGGRGLPLLQALAEHWGSKVCIQPDGQVRHVVWFALSRRCRCCQRE